MKDYLIEFVLVCAVIGLVIVLIISTRNRSVTVVATHLGSMEVTSKGTFRGYYWTEFKDTNTGTRIFHYAGSMIVLPKD